MKMITFMKSETGSPVKIPARIFAKRRTRRRTTQSGQALLEVALVTPLLLLLAVGIIEIGRYAYYSILVANAARAGAQYGAQNLATAADKAGIRAAAENDGQNFAGLTVKTVQQECGCTGSSIGGTCPATGCAFPNHALVYVKVTVTGTFNSLFKYPGIPQSIDCDSTELMRVAQ
jgi:Flp pilus assembly protein TadG